TDSRSIAASTTAIISTTTTTAGAIRSTRTTSATRPAANARFSKSFSKTAESPPSNRKRAAEDGRRKTEDGRRRTEDRGRRTEDRIKHRGHRVHRGQISDSVASVTSVFKPGSVQSSVLRHP